MRWRARSRSRTRSPEPAPAREDLVSLELPYEPDGLPRMRFAWTAVADRIAWRRSVPVGMSSSQLGQLRDTIWASWKRYPLSVGGAAALRRLRASSSGELGASGRSRSGTGLSSPYAHAARPPPVRPPRWGRPLCDRCLRQRPGDRIKCVLCQRRVGPGCTPGCLLVEWRGAARERVGLCADWPHCRAPGAEGS